MLWAGFFLAGLVVTAILLLTPIKLSVVWSADERQLAIRYLGFGHTTDFLAKTRIIDWLGLRLYRRTTALTGPPKKKPSPRRAKKEKPTRAPTKFTILIKHRWTIALTMKRALRYLARLLTSPRLRLARLDIVAGAENPALTGMYYGWYQSLRPAWRSQRALVNWQPVFHKQCFAARFDGRVWLFPWHPVKHTVRLIQELPKLALYRLYKDMKRQEA